MTAELRERLMRLADEWVSAEEDADDYGPRNAYDGRDCAEMLRDALVLPPGQQPVGDA